MQSLKKTIMERDNLTEEQAEEQIREAREALNLCLEAEDFDGAENICETEFGLEPDYLMDLIL